MKYGKVTVEVILTPAWRLLDRPGYSLIFGVDPVSKETPIPAESVRGACPQCGDMVIANMYHSEFDGYGMRYECRTALLTQAESYTGSLCDSCDWHGVINTPLAPYVPTAKAEENPAK